MQVLVKEHTDQALLDIEKKPSKMQDNQWVDLDIQAKATIILYLQDEVLYNVTNEETTAIYGISWRVSTRRIVYPTNSS